MRSDEDRALDDESGANEAGCGDFETPAARWGRVAARAAVCSVGVALLAISIASFAGTLSWWLDLPAHFRPLLALGLLITALLQLLAWPRRLAAVWALGAVLNGIMIAPLYLSRLAPVAGERLSIVHSNTGHDGGDVTVLAAWLKQHSPDLISLQEVTPRSLPRIIDALSESNLGYDLLVAEPRNDTRGVALLSRRSGVSARIVRPTPDQDRPMIEAELELSGTRLALLGFHATRPAPAGPYGNQRIGMDGAARWSRLHADAGAERVLLGDFNSTSQGALVKRLCRTAELRDGRRGHGWQGTGRPTSRRYCACPSTAHTTLTASRSPSSKSVPTSAAITCRSSSRFAGAQSDAPRIRAHS